MGWGFPSPGRETTHPHLPSPPPTRVPLGLVFLRRRTPIFARCRSLRGRTTDPEPKPWAPTPLGKRLTGNSTVVVAPSKENPVLPLPQLLGPLHRSLPPAWGLRSSSETSRPLLCPPLGLSGPWFFPTSPRLVPKVVTTSGVPLLRSLEPHLHRPPSRSTHHPPRPKGDWNNLKQYSHV